MFLAFVFIIGGGGFILGAEHGDEVAAHLSKAQPAIVQEHKTEK